jgi:hypothetical protein
MMSNLIDVSMRFCGPGEIEENNQWIVWAYGSYSLGWNSTQCNLWIENAVWLGSDQISIDSGYWRKTKDTTTVVTWIHEPACEGGYFSNEKHPVHWKDGYTGVLWGEWDRSGDDKYEKVSNFECLKCPNDVVNAIRVVGLILLVLVFYGCMIAINVRKKEESQQSILMRIMTNYLQILSVALSFNIKYPILFSNIFSLFQVIGSSSRAFVSFDWFIGDNTLFSSLSMFKIFLTALLPIVLFVLISMFWLLVYLIFNKWNIDLKRNMIVSLIVILFMLHPTLSISSFSLFQCTKIDSNDFRVTIDLKMTCYSSEHLLWMVFLGIPMLLIWWIGLPMLGLAILIKNRSKLNTLRMK